MISSESRTISGLRRIRTPRAPVQKRKPASARYQTTSGPFTASTSSPVIPRHPDARWRGGPSRRLPGVAPQDDAGQRGQEEGERGELQPPQVVGQEEAADVIRAA